MIGRIGEQRVMNTSSLSPAQSCNKVTKDMLEELCALLAEPEILSDRTSQRPEASTNVARKPPPPETQDEIEKLKKALATISSDVRRGRGHIEDITTDPQDYWLAVIWAIHSLNWNCGKQIAIDWSRQSDRFKGDEFDDAWDSYDEAKENRVGIGSLYMLAQTLEIKSQGPLVFEVDRIANEKQKNEAQVVQNSTVFLAPIVASPYTFRTASELQNLPRTIWRVKGLFPNQGLGSIYGPSGSGKTFLALEWSAAIALGRSFFGRKTTQCPVVYVALEGTGGIARRIEAYEKLYNTQLPNSFRVVTDMLSLFSAEAAVFAEAVVEARLDEGVIVIDTLAQSAPGSDENSSAHMGTIIHNAQVLQRMTKGLVVLIHHTGKDASRGARGHSSLFAALDAALEVKRTLSGLEWRSAKVKDGPDGIATPFRLEQVVLGTDEDGDEISSCVAVGDLFRKPPLAQPTGKNQKAVLDALVLKYVTGSTISADEVLDVARAALPDQTKNSTQRAKEAVKGLVEIDRLELSDDKYTLVCFSL